MVSRATMLMIQDQSVFPNTRKDSIQPDSEPAASAIHRVIHRVNTCHAPILNIRHLLNRLFRVQQTHISYSDFLISISDFYYLIFPLDRW